MLLEMEGRSRRRRSTTALAEVKGFGRSGSVIVDALRVMVVVELKVAAARDGLGCGGCEIRRQQRRLQRRQRQWLKVAAAVAEERSLGNEKQVLTMGCGRRLEREQGKEEEEDEGNDWGSRGQGTMTADVGQCWSGAGRRCWEWRREQR
ncbi:hypothetical protein BHE74_00003521 [Ensete ventricosum]|nr:hypothetical protein BHE74_00003521 [Ensete ventricosum]